MRGQEPRNEQIEVVRSHVESGVMTQAQARRIFDELIFPGSDMQRKMEAELDRVGVEIDRAVANGRITAEQGQMKLDAVRDGMDERREYYFRMSVLGMTKSDARLSVLADALARMVAAGTLSQEEADAKFSAVEREIGMESRVQEHLEKLGQEIRVAIELGELTPEEGRARMQEARRGIEAKIKCANIERRIEAAVESGSMTREDADAKYAELRATLGAMQQPMTVKVESVEVTEETEAGKVIKLDVVVPDAEMKKADDAGERLELEIIVEPAGSREDADPSDDSTESGVRLRVEPVLKSQDAVVGSADVQLVPVLEDGPLILEGVDAGALESRLKQEQGAFEYYKRNQVAKVEALTRAEVESGRITKQDARARIDDELRRQRFVARWLSIDLMYQDQVSAGKLTVDEANKLLMAARKTNGYFDSPYRSQGTVEIVEPDHVFEVSTERVGEPGGQPIGVEMKVEPKPESKKLTPMDEEFWHFQGIRSLSEYEEEIPEDC
ncbi:MAG: hypothetical protein R3B67_14085 [Phycisphaerales bacterium]